MSSYEHEPTSEKGYPKYESHEDYMKRRIHEEEDASRKLGVNVEYNNMRLTKEIVELKKEIKRLQTHCNMI
jgi:hypothetical protein